jgi:hypothetical protein
VFIKFPKKKGFVQGLIDVSIEANKIGINVLCVHIDADNRSQDDVFEFFIAPALDEIGSLDENICCRNIVPIIPVRMTEAWLLADKELLKNEIGTSLSDIDLEINREAELVADPKTIIEKALIIAQSRISNRRNRITISDLYQPIGQKLTIEKLQALSAFNRFSNQVAISLKALNYLT